MQGIVVAVIMGDDGQQYSCLTGIEHEVGARIEFEVGINLCAMDVEALPYDEQVDPRIIAMGSRRWEKLALES